MNNQRSQFEKEQTIQWLKKKGKKAKKTNNGREF